jgi:hypothetical protein
MATIRQECLIVGRSAVRLIHVGQISCDMKIRSRKIIDWLIGLLIFGLTVMASTAQQNQKEQLAAISSLFVAEISSANDKKWGQDFRTQLEKGLQEKGFIIQSDKSHADAILKTECLAEIVLDGDGSIPNYAIYEFQLYTQKNVLIKKWKIKFASQATKEKDDEMGIQRFTEQIQKDKKKALK